MLGVVTSRYAGTTWTFVLCHLRQPPPALIWDCYYSFRILPFWFTYQAWPNFELVLKFTGTTPLGFFPKCKVNSCLRLERLPSVFSCLRFILCFCIFRGVPLAKVARRATGLRTSVQRTALIEKCRYNDGGLESYELASLKNCIGQFGEWNVKNEMLAFI